MTDPEENTGSEEGTALMICCSQKRGRSASRVALLLCVSTAFGCMDWDGAKEAFCVNNPRCPEHGKLIWVTPTGSRLGRITEMAVLPDGAIALNGAYDEDTGVGADRLAYTSGEDALLVVLAKDGSNAWARGITGSGSELITGLATNERGDLFSVGSSSSRSLLWTAGDEDLWSIDGGEFEYGFTRAVVSKHSRQGELAWTTFISGLPGSEVVPTDIQVSSNGETAVITGHYKGTVQLGPQTLQSLTPGLFVATLAPSGNVDDVVISGTCSSGEMQGQRLAFAAGGDLVLSALYEGDCSLGETVLPSTPQGKPGLALARVSLEGDKRWVRSYPEANMDRTVKVALISYGGDDWVVAASFKGIIQADLPIQVASRGRGFTDILLLGLAGADGTLRWATRAGGESDDKGRGVWVDSQAHIWLVGSFDASAQFDEFTLSAEGGGADAFLAEYDGAGKVIRVLPYGGIGDGQTMNAIASHPAGIAIAGESGGAISIGNQHVNSAARGFAAVISFPSKNSAP